VISKSGAAAVVSEGPFWYETVREDGPGEQFDGFEVVVRRSDTPDRVHVVASGRPLIGESGTIGSTPAVQNAVVDALSHFGVRHLDMPFTAERVWRAIQHARAG